MQKKVFNVAFQLSARFTLHNPYSYPYSCTSSNSHPLSSAHLSNSRQ